MSRVNEFSPSSSWTAAHRGHTVGHPPLSTGYGQPEWSPQAVFQDNTRAGTLAAGYRPFLDGVPTRPFGVTSTSLNRYRPAQIIIFNNMSPGSDSRLPPMLYPSTSRQVSQGTIHMPADTDDSQLTKEEQGIVLQNLRKHVYSPVPKVQPRRVCLYYRELNRDYNSTAADKHKDEDGKNCAVCLEDFEPREEVMLTPCNHMFHEECIVPWVKNHGKCPVCRSALCESARENSSAMSSNRGYFQPAGHRLLADEVLSLFQAVDAAFIRGA